MGSLDRILDIMQKDLEGIKNNLAHGKYRSQETYFEVLGEAKILIKMISEVEKLLQAEEVDDGVDED